MTSLAADISTALAGALPDSWKVTGYPGASATRVDRPTVAVWTNTIEHAAGSASTYVLGIAVELITPHTDPGKADAALDDMLQVVLGALWGTNGTALDRGERTSNAENTLHSWRLTVRRGITITEED